MGIDREKEDGDRIEVQIQIGRVRKTMVLVKTTAPSSYDGFGTFTLYEDAGGIYSGGKITRIVLIDVVHFGWQTDRYSSGLNGWEYYGDQTGLGWAEEKLFDRLTGKEGDE